MDTLGLCQPASAILLVSVAGVLYHLAVGALRPVVWWALVGLIGTGVFQGLCYGGLEPVAWILASIPILIVCFFLAVALLASKFRIQNVEKVDCRRHTRCDRCSDPSSPCGGSPSPCSHRKTEEKEELVGCPCGCGQNPAACDPARCRFRCAVNT